MLGPPKMGDSVTQIVSQHGYATVRLRGDTRSVNVPVRDSADGFMRPVRVKGLVYTLLAVVTGLILVIGGPPALDAFQVRPKSRGRRLVLSIVISWEASVQIRRNLLQMQLSVGYQEESGGETQQWEEAGGYVFRLSTFS